MFLEATASSRSRLATFAGSLGAAWFVSWRFGLDLRTGTLSPLQTLLTASAYLSVTVGAAIVVFLCMEGRKKKKLLLRVCGCAAWFAPFSFLLVRRSLFVAVPAAILIISITKLIASHSKEPNESGWWYGITSSLSISLFAQAGAAAFMVNEDLIAFVSLSVGLTLLSWRIARRIGASSRQSLATAWILLLFALNTTVLGLWLFMRKTPVFATGGFPTPTGNLNTSAPTPPGADVSNQDSAGVHLGGKHLGVLLFPKVKKHVTLVPPLPALGKSAFGPTRRDPLVIPFFGVYWFFQYPDKAPPKHSFRTTGTPSTATFRAADHSLLRMEARQNLATFFDVACCRQVEITVENADRFADSIAVELYLVNTALPHQPQQKLGMQRIESTAPEQVLTYPMIRSGILKQFDEFRVVYRLMGNRVDRSANVSVVNFRLVP